MSHYVVHILLVFVKLTCSAQLSRREIIRVSCCNLLTYLESIPFVGTQALPGINVVKFPTNAQPAVLRALLNGTVDVAVERPETIQYYNNKVRLLL